MTTLPTAPSPLIAGPLDKRNAFGLWSTKWAEVSANGQRLTIHDKEGAPVSQTLDITNIGRSDNTTLLFQNKTEEVPLRASSTDVSDDWYETVRDALVDNRVIPHPNYGLPYEDPRNGLPFCEIPPEYFIKFKDLKKSVLYWFGCVTKYGNINSLTGNPKIEERIAFLGDKAFYVTRPNSEITRCIKIERLVGLFTNLGSKDLQDKAPFLVLKLDSNDEYDLCFEGKNILPLIRALKVLFRANSRDKTKQLKVVTVATYNDPIVAVSLHRPPNFEMVTVIPSSKIELRKRLQAYYQQKGIAPPPIERRPRKVRSGAPTATERHPSTLFETKSTASSSNNAAGGANPSASGDADKLNKTASGGDFDVPNTDPLGVYLLALGLPQYYVGLYKQQLDLDLLDCMDEVDFKNFGVGDKAHIKTIMEHLHDDKFMAEIHAAVETNRVNANWSARTAPKLNTGMITLSDDEDDLPPVRKAPAPAPPQAANPTSPSATQGPRPAIVLDDSDDDLLVSAPKPPPKMVINLSDDDDL